ncbi:hypothetical protein EJC51_26725 [Streptomyces aquilus]|uniref:Uncharacterized protein n=1 Tax=Streptomyces aquilus TaxID=2548456 RepID=A0A3Q9C505_9ACTN|nr:hypothetical protein EJC51_26725 [Streptomyces aquilus]
MGAGRGWVSLARACGVPLRPPVPPQRHDCPQLGRQTGWCRYPQPRQINSTCCLGGRRPQRHDCPQLRRDAGGVAWVGAAPSGTTARSQVGRGAGVAARVGAAPAARLPVAVPLVAPRCGATQVRCRCSSGVPRSPVPVLPA